MHARTARIVLYNICNVKSITQKQAYHRGILQLYEYITATAARVYVTSSLRVLRGDLQLLAPAVWQLCGTDATCRACPVYGPLTRVPQLWRAWRNETSANIIEIKLILKCFHCNRLLPVIHVCNHVGRYGTKRHPCGPLWLMFVCVCFEALHVSLSVNRHQKLR